MALFYENRIELPQLDAYPIVLDYDFRGKRPRGGSACVDMFSFGKLCSLMDALSDAGIVYVQKTGLMPLGGFFLVDFAEVYKNPALLKDAIRNMNISELWVEDSARFPLDKLENVFEGVDATMVNFRG